MAEGQKTSKSTSDSNILAMVSYIWILSIVMYVLKKEDPFVAFHAKQGMVIFVFSLLSWFSWVPFIGWIIGPLVALTAVVLSVLGMVKAYQGEKYKIPVVGDIAEKINF